MSVIEVCLIIIASCMVFKTLGSAYLVLRCRRTFRNRVEPLLDKTEGALDNISAATHAVRDQVDELRTVVDDVSYRAHDVARDVHERVLPPIIEVMAAFSNVARVAAAILSLFKKH